MLSRQVPHQWWSGSALNAGKWEVPSSIPGRACRQNRLEFSVVFSETCVNTGCNPLERPNRPETIIFAKFLSFFETI